MRRVTLWATLALIALVAAAPTPTIPLSDTRLSVNTLLREDVFAGFMDGDMKRLSRGETNADLLLRLRPTQKPTLLAWKAGALLFRAVRASETNRPDEFRRKYKQALELFTEARRPNPQDLAVCAITGGSYAIFADRLPEEYRAAAWSAAYEAYATLYRPQANVLDKLPVHLRGELLAGLAQSAQRTGRTKELAETLDRIVEVLPDTTYEPIARQWRSNPTTAVGAKIVCQSCHEAGRLAARSAELDKK